MLWCCFLCCAILAQFFFKNKYILLQKNCLLTLLYILL
jgi:hypothetical protein